MNAINPANSRMPARRSLSWLAGGLLAFLALPASASEKNLLVDGSFEEGSGTELSGNWSVLGGRPSTITREKVPGGSGDWTLKIHIPDGSNGAVAHLFQNVDMSSFKAGDTITISAVVKVEGSGSPEGRSAVCSLGPTANNIGALFLNLPVAAGDWEEIRYKFTLSEDFDPNALSSFKIHMFFNPEYPNDRDLDVFIDDIQVVGEAAAH